MSCSESPERGQGSRASSRPRVRIGASPRSLWFRWVLTSIMGGWLGLTGTLPALAQPTPEVGGSVTDASSKPTGLAEALVSGGRGGTQVDVPDELSEIFQNGGNPGDLASLRLLERQHQRVAESAAACTVSIRIGPAQGGGVIITETGYILTAAHVAMRPGKRAQILLSDGRVVRGTTLGMNRHVDAGLVRIDPGQNDGSPWPHATLGSSEDLRVGMWCVATGHPGGYDQSRGPVTRVGRVLQVRDDAITTDCALIGGDSGGPLFDMAGRLIAIHSRIGNDVADNLHVPIDHYDHSWDRLARGEAWGYLPGFKPVLGVTGNSELEEARIVEVKPGSPAESAGFRTDDVVERFGDVVISDFDSLRSAVADTMPGEQVAVRIRRDGERVRVIVEIGRADESKQR